MSNFIPKATKDITRGDIIRAEVQGRYQEVTVDYVTAARARGYLVAILVGGGQTALGHKSGTTAVKAK